MANKKTQNNQEIKPIPETYYISEIGKGRVVLIICLIGLSLLWLISLLTYNSLDLSYNSSNSNGQIHNAIGIFGSYSADYLLQFFGVLAYTVPFIILASCYVLIRKIKIKKLIVPLISLVLILFSVGSLIKIVWGNHDSMNYPIGGFLATMCVTVLLPILGKIGTTILMVIIFASGIVVGFGKTFEKIGVTCYAFIYTVIKNLINKIKQKREEDRLKKLNLIDECPDDGHEEMINGESGKEIQSDFKSVKINNQEVEGKWEIGTIPEEEEDIKVVVPEIEAKLSAVKEMVQLQKSGSSRVDENCEQNNEEPPPSPKNNVPFEVEEKETNEIINDNGSNRTENQDVPRIIVTTEGQSGGNREVLEETNTIDPKIDDQGIEEAEEFPSENKVKIVTDNFYQADFEDDDSPFSFDNEQIGLPNNYIEESLSDNEWPLNEGESSSFEEITGPKIVELDNGADSHDIAVASKIIKNEIAAEKKKEARVFQRPPLEFLDFKEPEKFEVNHEALQEKSRQLVATLESFGIKGTIREIRVGPVVTLFEFVPAPGIKISKISSLADDIAMSMQAMQVRIVAPIPGKGAVGIEIPNEHRQIVYLNEIVASEQFQKSKSLITLCLGKDIEGIPFVADLAKMPHLLIAGATGTGKSVGINAMLTSILYKATPEDVRLIMVDPKQLELSIYEGIPHLLLPVVCDPKKAALALHWAVEEMERRYGMMAEIGVRNLAGYNEKIKTMEEGSVSKDGYDFVHLPYIVILIDEFADLMMVASKEIETFVARLAQKARAAGIHLILATQRPSVDVITGTIKSNFPSRVSFQVSSGHDSRTVLDTVGAEHLLGMGDMLYMSAGGFGLTRVHGALVTETEIDKVVKFLKAQGEPQYDESILAAAENSGEGDDGDGEGGDKQLDELYDKAVAFVCEKRKVSVSLLQRYLSIGYNRSAKIVEQMERDGIIGPANGSKPREVLIPEREQPY